MAWLGVWWALRRALVYLKRWSIAAERQAVALETLARNSADEWEAKHAPRPRGKFVVGTLDQKAANEYYKELRRGDFDTD